MSDTSTTPAWCFEDEADAYADAPRMPSSSMDASSSAANVRLTAGMMGILVTQCEYAIFRSQCAIRRGARRSVRTIGHRYPKYRDIFSILILARVLGKRQLSQLTFFDFLVGTAIGSMSGSISVDPSLKFTPAWLSLLLWVFWALVLSTIRLYSRKWRKIIDGEPTIVVRNGKILETKMKNLNYNVDALRMQLRNKGVFSLSDVEFAVLEPDGMVSVLKKSQVLPVTPADLNIPTTYKGLPVEPIVDGRVVHPHLLQLGLTSEWLHEQLKHQGHEITQVHYAEIDTNGNLYVDLHDDQDALLQRMNISDSRRTPTRG